MSRNDLSKELQFLGWHHKADASSGDIDFFEKNAVLAEIAYTRYGYVISINDIASENKDLKPIVKECRDTTYWASTFIEKAYDVINNDKRISKEDLFLIANPNSKRIQDILTKLPQPILRKIEQSNMNDYLTAIWLSVIVVSAKTPTFDKDLFGTYIDFLFGTDMYKRFPDTFEAYILDIANHNSNH